MAHLVMKFGGTSLADLDHIRQAGRHIAARAGEGHAIVVVVSAMGGETDRLVDLTQQAVGGGDHDFSEHDLVLSAGEQVSAGLLALVLQGMGLKARSFLGWQIPICTDGHHGAARMNTIDTAALEKHLSAGQIVVVAGFQGIGPDGRITVLGRGGSDTSAAALAAALGAECCEIYTDVDGVYTADPRIVQPTRRLDKIAYEEMLEMASQGARVLQTRSVELAMARQVSLRVLPSHSDSGESSGTEICAEDQIMEQQTISSVACVDHEAKITLIDLADKPGIAAKIFSPLAKAGILVDMIVQTSAGDKGRTDITFTVAGEDLPRALKLLQEAQDEIGFENIDSDANTAKVSVIGIGMRSHTGIAETMFCTLAQAGINIQAISTSEIKISVLVASDEMKKAARLLHAAYGLGG